MQMRCLLIQAHLDRALARVIERLDAGYVPTDGELDELARLEARRDAAASVFYQLGGRR